MAYVSFAFMIGFGVLMDASVTNAPDIHDVCTFAFGLLGCSFAAVATIRLA